MFSENLSFSNFRHLAKTNPFQEIINYYPKNGQIIDARKYHMLQEKNP